MSDYRDRVLAALEAFATNNRGNLKAPTPKQKKPKSTRDDIPTEAQEQNKVAALLDQLTVEGVPVVWAHPPNESYGIGPRAGRNRKRAGCKAGLPDLLIFTPGPTTGKPVAIEMKRLKYSSTTQEQKDWLQKLDQECGWNTYIAKGFDQAVQILKVNGYIT